MTSKKGNKSKKEDIKKIKKEEQMPKTNSKKTVFVILIIVAVMLLGFVLNKNNPVFVGLELHNPDENLDFNYFLSKMENREDDKLVFLTLFMDTKTDATLYKAMVEKIVSEYNFDEYYIYYTNEMTAEENKKLATFLDGEVSAYPMTFLIKNGKVVDYIWGYQVESSYLEELGKKIENLESYKKTADE